MRKLNFLLKEDGKKAIKILGHSIDGNDRIWLKLQGFKEKVQFNKETQDIVLGGKVVEPMLSYAINSWNVMLPYITYRMDKENVEKYLDSIKLYP
jgi:hypothetical protein